MVTNSDIAHALERIAGLIEVRGDNPFKVRAYRTAVAQIENLGEELAVIHAAGGLRDIPGFGEAIARKVEEMIVTGRMRVLEELEAEIPPSLLEVRALPGVGPKMALTLWREAGISSVEQLEAAATAGRLAGLPRVGQRTVDNLLRSLEARRRAGAGGRRPRDDVAPVVERVLGALRSCEDAERVEVAGSFRRRRPTIGDLDVVVGTHRPLAVLETFCVQPGVERVVVRGDTKCSVEMDRGLQVDCRAVAPEEFGAAWQYFTGSQAHNVRLRGLALRRGLTLNEYGLYAVDGGGRIAGATEEEVYRALGLRWIPPERREDRGEIEEARLEPAPMVEA